jgi:hypothetical protein
MRLAAALCLAVSALFASACAHRTVMVHTEPEGAFVTVNQHIGMTAVSPGPLVGLRASRNYTVRAVLAGYDPTFAEIAPAPGVPWPWPINQIVGATGAYDSEITVKLLPCTDPAGCSEGQLIRR